MTRPTLYRTTLALLFAAFAMGATECDDDPGPAPGVCQIGDTIYGNGDTGVPAGDGCNTCTCVDGEPAHCTEADCAPDPGTCELGGFHYPDGTTGIPAPDGCNTCHCDDGVLGCTEIGCSPPGCDVGDAHYDVGDSGIPAPDGCNTCACTEHGLACTERACPPDGMACSVYGERYADGWAPAADGCNTCECDADGEVTSSCSEAACGPIPIASCDDLSPFDGDGFELGALSVTGDTLTVEVSYSGGCQPHYFRLCYDPAFLESFPVQAALRLEHDGQGDPCEAYPTETRAFDLTPLRDAYVEAYREEHATVVLRLGDGATYTF